MIATYPAGKLEAAAWIDLVDPSDEEARAVATATGLRVPTRDDVSEIESSSRLAFEAGAFYVSTSLVTRVGDSELGLSPVGFVLGARVLVTIRFDAVGALDEARAECGKLADATAENAFLRILETIVDRAADGLERAGGAADALSLAVFRPRGSAQKGLRPAVEEIGRIARRASLIGEALLGVGRICAFVTESKVPGAPPVDASRMKAIRADITSLTDYENRLSANLQFILDATLGFISIEQNEIVKTLTIASVVGIPPVLIAGIYGMNFKAMPELSWRWGYPFALALIVLSGALPLIWFKRRGWM